MAHRAAAAWIGVVELSAGAASWTVKKALEPGIAGYSDLAVMPDGTILCLYETGSNAPPNGTQTRELVLARFNLEWLTDGQDSLAKGKKH